MGTDWKRAEKSLACLVQGLIGENITVELRNEAEARGLLTFADAHMNLIMENVTYTKSDGRRVSLPTVYLQGRNIRYIPIPDMIDPMATIRAHIAQTQRAGYKRRYLAPDRKRIADAGRGRNQQR